MEELAMTDDPWRDPPKFTGMFAGDPDLSERVKDIARGREVQAATEQVMEQHAGVFEALRRHDEEPSDPGALLRALQADACNFAANPAALGDAFDKAVAALRAVLDLHRPVPYTNIDLGIHDDTVCLTCHSRMAPATDWDGEALPLVQDPYPCPTVRAIIGALGGTDG